MFEGRNNIIQDITKIELSEEESEDDADGKIIPEWKQNEDTTMHSAQEQRITFKCNNTDVRNEDM